MSDSKNPDALDIHAYADGQLDSSLKPEVGARLESDPQARAEYESVVTIKRLLTEKCVPAPNDELWKACRKRLDEIDKTRKVEGFVSRYAWGLCALLFVGIIGGGMLYRRNGQATLYTGDVPSLASALAPISLPQSQEPNEVRQYIREKTGGAPIEFSSGALQLISVMQGEREGRKLSMFNFADREGTLSLLVVPGTVHVDGLNLTEEGRYCHGVIGTMYCVSWVDDGFALLLIGKRDTNALQRIASNFRIR